MIVTDNYQSNGRCFDDCKANYAFAVVQDTSCWCSNYVPADTVEVGSCNEKCPGYGFENCGSLSDGLFGYVALNKQPSGTIGASTSSSPTPTPTTSSSSSSTPPPSTKTVVSAQPVSSSLSTRSVSDLPQSLAQSAASASGSRKLPTSLFVGSSLSSSPLTTSSMARYGSHFDSSLQNVLPSPNTVTVEQTVTASQSVVLSVVSIVRFSFVLIVPKHGTMGPSAI